MGPSSLWGAASSVWVPCSIGHPILLSRHPLSLRGAGDGVGWPLTKVPRVQEHPGGLLSAAETPRGDGLILHPTSGKASTSCLPSPSPPRDVPWWEFHGWGEPSWSRGTAPPKPAPRAGSCWGCCFSHGLCDSGGSAGRGPLVPSKGGDT